MTATITNAVVPTADTNNVTAYPTPSFTPAFGDLLVIFAIATGTVATGTATASANGMTFSKITSALKNVSADTLYAFVSNQFAPASPAAMTCTFDCTGDAATGAIVSVARISGLIVAGTAAIRQSQKVENVLGGVAPATTFGVAPLTGNPILFGIGTTVATGATAPTGSPTWTEQVDTTYATPTTGGGYYSVPSGYTATTITLGSTTNGACCAIALEIDASVIYPRRTREQTHHSRPMANASRRSTRW